MTALLASCLLFAMLALVLRCLALALRDMADGVWDDDDRWAWSTEAWDAFNAACDEWKEGSS